MFHPLVGFTFKQLPVRIMGVCFCVLCPLKSLQDTLLWWRWAQIFTSAASASSSIIISRSFSPISKMDAPYPALTHQPPLQRQFLQVKTPYIVVSLHAKKKWIYSHALTTRHHSCPAQIPAPSLSSRKPTRPASWEVSKRFWPKRRKHLPKN